jgi:group I intron endonuclease
MSIKNWNAESCCVYSITNKLNGMQYVGVAKNHVERFNQHSYRKEKGASYINRAIQSHGRDNFEFKVLLFASREYCLDIEAKLVEAYNCLVPNGYNLCAGGRGRIQFYKGENHPQYGKRPTQEAIEKMRKALTGKKQAPMPEHAKKAISNAVKAQWADPEQRKKKIFGIKSSITVAKRLAISIAQKGRIRTEAQKLSHSEKMKAKWSDPEYRAKAIEARQRRSKESYMKQSESMKHVWASKLSEVQS